jgi:uncharacterized protein
MRSNLRFLAHLRTLPYLIVLTLGIAAIWQMLAWLRAWRPVAERRHLRFVSYVLFAALAGWLAFDFVSTLPRIKRLVPSNTLTDIVRAVAMLFAGVAVATYSVLAAGRLAWRRLPPYDPSRRRWLAAATGAAAVAPAGVLGFGVITRKTNIQLREVDVGICGLPRDLDGLRMVQLTDIHLSPFFTPADLERAIGIANEMRAHIALVTGDIINTKHDPLDRGLELLRHLRSDAGIYGCLGNHEWYPGCEEYATNYGARLGIRFFDRSAETLRFGDARLRLCGVRHQSTPRYYLHRTEQLIEPDAFHVLLSHNPDVFPVAARKGFDLTIAGHTHGGQINLEILNSNLNVARIFTPYVDGVYRIDDAAIFVSRGLGTVGPPLRLGAPPEVALIRLCAT